MEEVLGVKEKSRILGEGGRMGWEEIRRRDGVEVKKTGSKGYWGNGDREKFGRREED